jgi:cytochrome P450
MVTGYDEALTVLGDSSTFSSCMSVTGPFPGFPVPLEGDDVSDLIEAHRDAIPMSDQIITLDPPTHTDHRALLMGLITPKRLKENEAFMWELADRVLDSYLTGGRGEFIGEFASTFSLLVIADLLGVPEEDRDEFAAVLGRSSEAGVGSTDAEPSTVGGVDIPAGTTLMVLNGAANRDPKQFDDPDTLDPARPNARRHIAFGRGVHSCPGAPLARAEARVCIERLLDRTTDIRIAEDKHGPAEDRHYQYVPTFILRGLTELHLEFTL